MVRLTLSWRFSTRPEISLHVIRAAPGSPVLGRITSPLRGGDWLHDGALSVRDSAREQTV